MQGPETRDERAAVLQARGPADPRVGVYVCHCGSNIAGVVDCAAVAAYGETLPGVVVSREDGYLCSEPGQNLIKTDIREQGLNRIVVASCSPRLHEPTFRKCASEAGLNPYLVEMANLREQCSWVHSHDPEGATHKSKDLLRSAVARAAGLRGRDETQVPVEPAALVVGGGVAGIQAALDLADSGYQVIMVEKRPSIGGVMAWLDKTYPTMDCSI
jgi:heterodisulfide reductase subunit A2